MIKDKLTNLNKYKINDDFELLKTLISKNGDYSDVESPLKAIKLEYKTKDFDLTKFENHRKFIDVHYIVSGRELVGVADILDVKSNMEYDEQSDYQLFDGVVKECILLEEGEFLVLFENETHVTGGRVEQNSEKVKKIVFKVPISDIN